MTNYIILSKTDMNALCSDKPVWFSMDGKAYKLCTDECFEKERKPQFEEPKEKVADEKNQIDAIFAECKTEQERLLGEIGKIINADNGRKAESESEFWRHWCMGAWDRIAELDNNITKWKEAIEKIKAEIQSARNEMKVLLAKAQLETNFFAEEEIEHAGKLLDDFDNLIDKHTKELM